MKAPVFLIIAPLYATALAFATDRALPYLQWVWVASWSLAVTWLRRIVRFGLPVDAIQVVEA